MNDAAAETQEQLAAECSALSRYLVGRRADERLQREYAAFCRSRPEPMRALGLFDRLSLQLLRSGLLGVALVDAYVSRMRRAGPAFERLVGMLALLECLPESSALLDRPDSGGPAWIVLRLVARALLDGVALLVSTLVLGPVHLVQTLRQSREPNP